MSKILLIETLQVKPSQVNKPGPSHYVKESVGGRLIITLPATVCDKKNLNERVYGSTLMENVSRNAKPSFESRELLSSVNEHPSEPYVTPGQASHIVIDSWVKDGVFYNKWEILETATGKDLRALVEANVAFGVSIRGVGSVDYQGNILEDYEFLGCDCVAEPSAQLRVKGQVVKENSQPSIFKKESNTMKTKESTLAYLGEQRVLIDSELKTNRIAAFQRVAAVETALSESSLGGKDIADVYHAWNSIKTETLKAVDNKPENLSESANSLLTKTLERRTNQLKVMSKGITQIAEQLKLTKEASTLRIAQLVSEKKVGGKTNDVQFRRSVAINKRMTTENSKLKLENKQLLNAATKHNVAYRLAVKEAAKLNVAYKMAIKEAAKLAKGKKLIVVHEGKQKLTESAFSFFTDADYQVYAGAGKPFGKMEPMISEGANYQAVLAGTDNGVTQIQVFTETGSSFYKNVDSYSDFYQFASQLPETVTESDLTGMGFTSMGAAFGESVKKSKTPVTESRKIINNTKGATTLKAEPAKLTAHERGEHAFKGWM